MPPEKFRVALVQMSCGPEPEQNLEKALSRVADAAGRGAKVVCLPELFQTQYFCQREDHSLFDLAEPIPGPTTEKLAASARSNGVVLIASLFEKRAAAFITTRRQSLTVMGPCGVYTARCTFRMTRSITKSSTSRRGTWDFVLWIQAQDGWAPWFVGISGIPREPG